MIRASVLLCLMLSGVSARAEPIQRLERDTLHPSLVDLSNGEPGWGEPVRRGGASVTYYGPDMSLQNSPYWAAARMEYVSGYVRRDGTFVPPYVRAVPRR
jgi:hypothetical protein